MKKILLLSIVMTLFAACSHKMMGGHGGCACDKGKPCAADSKGCGDSKEAKKEDCEDCKKAK